jgi:uncharacterized protein involved in oxidation of intracellular sulfur
MTLLVILNHRPYDGTDVTWNALRLAKQGLAAGLAVRVYLMNEAIDLARPEEPPAGSDDLHRMLAAAIAAGAEAKLCQTCITRCSVGTRPFVPQVSAGTMPELVDWVATSGRVLTF